MSKDLRKFWVVSEKQRKQREKLIEYFSDCPIPKNEILANLGIFLNGPTLARILFMNDLYQKIIGLHGVIVEFGCRWGTNLCLFSNFRGFYEPFNFNRKIIGFDTFKGFASVSPKDGPLAIKQDFNVTAGYEDFLDRVMSFHEQENPVPNIKKYEIIKGDAPKQLKKYLKDNPETIIALAYFDLDLYEPTKECLKLIQGHLAKGSIIGFDELNHHHFPGETLALKEVMGLEKNRILRSPNSRLNSFISIE
jgi:hypothetical protein